MVFLCISNRDIQILSLPTMSKSKYINKVNKIKLVKVPFSLVKFKKLQLCLPKDLKGFNFVLPSISQ